MGVFIGIFVAVIIVMCIVGFAKTTKNAADHFSDSKVWKEERERGNIVRRDNAIWKEEERFFTTAAYEKVRDKIKSIDTSKMRIKVTLDSGVKN